MLCLLVSSIKIQAQLSAAFSASNSSGCSPIVVSFTDQSAGSPSEWRWDLGNGTFSTLQHPSTTYITPGSYTVKLWTRSGNHTDSIVQTNYITVFKSPVVEFTAANTTGCSPLTVQFTDQSVINGDHIISRQWDFGDGILSDVQNPQHVYSLSGNFNVTLKVTAGNGCTSARRKSSFITNNTIQAAFRNWSFNNCSSNKIVFQNQSTGDGHLQYNWQFGDGTASSETDPVHIFAAAGIYNVQLITLSEFGCRDTFIKNITVTMPPAAAFSANNTVNCQAPAVVQFNNQTIGNNTYEWSFGDSSTSAVASPSHYYAQPGAYTVKLVVKYAGNCTDTLTLPNYIKVQKLLITPQGLPDSGCIPFTKHFTADISSYDPIVSYAWNIDNRVTLQGQAPVYTFTTPGVYNLSLITTSQFGCRDTVLIPEAVKAGAQPVAGFSADILNTCASTIINFSDLSTGNITSWEWEFGDQAVSIDKNPIHIYEDTGWMPVLLTVRSMGCADTVSNGDYIYIKPAVAKFKPLLDCSTPYKRTFLNFSIGATRWQWDFGDGTLSNEFSPLHIFPRPGIYNVTLFTWNDSTGCNYSSTKTVQIIDVQTGFAAIDTAVCINTNVVFSAVAHPDITKYNWNFGDESYLGSTLAQAQHKYTTPGSYTVTLVVKDTLGCTSVLSKTDYITANGVKAKFGIPASYVCLNTPVNFIDSSILFNTAVKKWEWNYGDGVTETLFTPPFTHSYAVAGKYYPYVKLTDSLGCTDSFRFATPIRAERISSFFYISDSIACPRKSIKFVCPYSTPGVTYRWDFGDGETSAQQIPFHAYTNEGVYTVRLHISRENGCMDSMVLNNAVRVKQTKASFTISDTFTTCPPLLVTFTGHSQNALDEYWSFGDSTYAKSANPSHFYTYPGAYRAVLIAKGPGGCTDSMYKTVTINGPTGSIVSDRRISCAPYNYNFTAHTQNTVSYVWDYGDGVTQNGIDSAVNHIYPNPGKFIPKMILTDANGCRVPVISKDTLTNVFVQPAFVLSDSILCSNTAISFTHTTVSNDSLSAFTWHFGDGSFSSQPNTSYQYQSTGTFYPSLGVTTANGCTGSFNAASPVTVLTSPAVSIETTGNGCSPLKAAFHAVTGTPGAGLMKWKWNFGNGDTSVLQNPAVQTYSTPGNYTVTLTGTAGEGCDAVAQTILTVYESPLTSISGSSAICRGAAVALQATGAQKYKWWPATGLNCDTCAVVSAQPITNAQYVLTGTSQDGCSSSDTMTIEVHQPFQLQLTPLFNICKGQTASLNVSGADSYKWSPSDGLSNSNTSRTEARPDSSMQYTVTGSDRFGCFTDSQKVQVNVHGYPTVKASEDKTVMLGTPVLLEATYSADVNEVRWSPTESFTRYDSNSVLVKPTINTEYTVKVKNMAGCSASDRVSVFVLCNQKNVFVPNLFSPNNDGVNDVFFPRGTGLLKIHTLRIFNRWGETVFEKKGFNANDPAAGWDGTYKGTRLTSDVFVYTLDLVCENNSVMSLRGNISLVQ